MKVFISWSGDASKQIAETFRKWLPSVLQATKPYFSPDDISKGAKWSSEISKELDQTNIGLIIVTSDNQDAQWLMFESGALAKNLEQAKVVPLLFNLEPADIKGPLVQFQASEFSKDEMLRVVKMINNELSERKLEPEVLDQVFEMWWPSLKRDIELVVTNMSQTQPHKARNERDILEEVLALVRSNSRPQREVKRNIIPNDVFLDLIDQYGDLLLAVQNDPTNSSLLRISERIWPPIKFLVTSNQDTISTKIVRAFDQVETQRERLFNLGTTDKNWNRTLPGIEVPEAKQ
ncbi:TIR domain-containing protein [Hyphococcus sp.]|jgi:hypothetical protein|uniref:TIR domain-containing protein n=1 Tax=Hyphococcus sp. TaxID=2038636 RepID=UPI003D0A4871